MLPSLFGTGAWLRGHRTRHVGSVSPLAAPSSESWTQTVKGIAHWRLMHRWIQCLESPALTLMLTVIQLKIVSRADHGSPGGHIALQ